MKKYLGMFLIVCCAACQQNPVKPNIEEYVSSTTDTAFIERQISHGRDIFYSIPTPVESVSLMKSAGAKYDQSLLSSNETVDNYVTNKSMALNLGIYTTDMSFSSLFGDVQTTVNFVNSSKKLAKELGIDIFDDETLKKLQDNLNNKDVVIDIVSESFIKANNELNSSEREYIASMVLMGGWIEGLYIATNIVDANKVTSKMAYHIYDQKNSLDVLIQMLKYNERKITGEKNNDLLELGPDLYRLSLAFNEIDMKLHMEADPALRNNLLITNGDSSYVTAIKTTTIVYGTAENIIKIKNIINKIRTKI